MNSWAAASTNGCCATPPAGRATTPRTGWPPRSTFTSGSGSRRSSWVRALIRKPTAGTGGMGEFLKVAAMLDSRGRKVATHSAGAGGALMQNVHCAFASPNTVICEVLPALGGLHTDVAGSSFVMEDGMVLPPTRPGLGIVLTDEIKNRYPFVPGSGEFNSVPGKVLTD